MLLLLCPYLGIYIYIYLNSLNNSNVSFIIVCNAYFYDFCDVYCFGKVLIYTLLGTGPTEKWENSWS